MIEMSRMSMLISALRRLVSNHAKATRSQTAFWFCLSLTFAAVYGALCLKQAFSGEYVVQDDARQHVFWMRRFLDSQLFLNDLIADYFQSVAPAGYTLIYRIPALAGIDPILLSKLLPFGLGLIMTAFCFHVSLLLLPVPFAGFVASMLLNQSVWMKYDLSSGTPRAFAIPLLLVFSYFLLKRSLIPCCVTIALLGLIYPHMLFIASGVLVLRLVDWQAGRLKLSDRQELRFCAIGLGVAVLVLLPYAAQSSHFGPAITAAQAKISPEFQFKGRAPFFDYSGPVDFWLFSRGSGFFPRDLPPLLLAGWALPIVWLFRRRLPLATEITQIAVLPQLLLASLGMFLLAHALLFRLHLPSRYTGFSLRMGLAIAAGLVIVTILNAVVRLRFGWVAVGLVIIALVFYPLLLDEFPHSRFVTGKDRSLYEFLAQKPKETLVASLAPQVDNVPTFARRATLAGREYGVPYQVGYYHQIRDRAEQLIQAQYSPDLQPAKDLIQKYGVDFWVLERSAFTPEYIAKHDWMINFPDAKQAALLNIQQGKIPAIAALSDRCRAMETEQLIVLQADCLASS